MTAIEVIQLNKSFGSIHALKDISLHVDKNQITGVIGPDGAGKSTLLRILIALEKYDMGEVKVLGVEVPASASYLKGRVGYMPERFSMYPDLSVKENLNFYAKIHNTSIAENYAVIEPIYVHLKSFEKRLAGRLSGGMKQKLALCCALIHGPEILILDEPTTGVDAVSRKDFWEILGRLVQSGLTVLVSTPYMDEANRCDKIVFLHKGEILAKSTPGDLKKSYSSKLFRIAGNDLFAMKSSLENSNLVKGISIFGNGLHVTIPGSEENGDSISRLLENTGFGNCTIKQIKPEIEDCFLDLLTAGENTEAKI
jgi:ABC-2 type transport system ATP-binding protein